MSRRETLFPSASVGRSQGSRIKRDTSQESLTAHPLLNPSPASTVFPPPTTDNTQNNSQPHTPPKYVPYTPRQRPSVGTAAQASVSVSGHGGGSGGAGGVTSKLQMQVLKAAVQGMGLGNESLGWAILEKLVASVNEGERGQWDEIWELITHGKATLLLPVEQAYTNELITPELLRDHIAFCNGPSTEPSSLVTLSGLRGTIHGESLTLRSALPPTSAAIQALHAPATRSSALLSLPPLPIPLSAAHAYPTYTLSSYNAHLNLPHSHTTQNTPSHGRVPSGTTTSRISNPFASFFSKSAAPSPPPPSILAHSDENKEHTVAEISAFAISRRIVKKEVGKGISKALKAEIKDGLTGVPSWVIERVTNFTASLHPIPKAPKQSLPSSNSSSSSPLNTSLAPDQSSPAALSDSIQSFYESIEDDLRAGGSPLIGRRKEDKGNDKVDEKERERREQEKKDNDERVRDVLEKVERVICLLFYDRLFRPSNSDDASHDEALASRIAALNLLDLGLEHLGVDVGKAGSGVKSVVKACGKTLQGLEAASCRAPADKAAALVAAHKAVVDGLSRLPPIRLKPEDEMPIDDQKTPLAPVFKENSAPDEVSPSQPITAVNPEPPSPLVEGKQELEVPSSPGPVPEINLPDMMPPLQRITSNTSVSTPLHSPPPSPTPVASDVLLPFVIFAVVKQNPAHLVSHLLFVQRYRSRNVGGEESFCLINALAVCEFLENVDLAALGLGDRDRVSVAELTPIPLTHGDSPTSPLSTSERLRGRVNQVGELAGSANKVISGVVDSSFTALRGLLGNAPLQQGHGDGLADLAPWNAVRPGFGLLRRGSGFSIASVAASLPIPGVPGKKVDRDEGGQQMIEVPSRPGSIRDHIGSDLEEEEDEGSGSEDDEESDGDEAPHDVSGIADRSDVRSIRSFGSMMSDREANRERKSLSDRLANVSALSRFSKSPPAPGDISIRRHSPPPSRRTSLLATIPPRPETPPTSVSPQKRVIAPPVSRFLECSPDELRVGEIGELLMEYRRVVEALRAAGGFEDAA